MNAGANAGNEAPLISVILPCYNVSSWIDRCLTALCEQTIGIDHIEILCVDDCSTDNTVEKLKGWETRYPEQICVICLEKNGRQGRARNIGLQYASAEWIAFVDSDDWVEPDYLESMYSAAQMQAVEVVCCDSGRDFSTERTFFADTDDGSVIKMEGGEQTDTSETICIASEEDRKRLILHPVLTYNAWGKLIRKDFLLDNSIFFPEYITYEDIEWGTLLHLYVRKACVLHRKLYHYFVNNSSTIVQKNSLHHIDCLTVQVSLWRELTARGFLEKYYEELEIEHIFSGYLLGLKMCFYRFEQPEYSIYLLLREMMLDHIGDYVENSYVKNGYLSEFHMLLLKSLDCALSKEEFLQMAETARKIGM